MIVETLPVGLLQCNCTVLACESSKEAIVVDPGGDVDKIVEILEHYELSVRAIVHTHAHIDHVMGTKELKQRVGGEIMLHPGDQFLYDNLQMQGMFLGMNVQDGTLPLDAELDHEKSLSFGDECCLVLHTPGHSPGSVCFQLTRGQEEQILISGDTLFRRGVGRTDLWGGSLPTMMDSLRERILTLDDDTRVIPGHGPETHIGDERRKNPFLV